MYEKRLLVFRFLFTNTMFALHLKVKSEIFLVRILIERVPSNKLFTVPFPITLIYHSFYSVAISMAGIGSFVVGLELFFSVIQTLYLFLIFFASYIEHPHSVKNADINYARFFTSIMHFLLVLGVL